MFRSFWVQARGVLDRPRTMLWGVRGAEWGWEILTRTGDRMWRWQMKTASTATMSRSVWVQAWGLLEQPRTFLPVVLNRAQWPWGILTGTGYRIWRWRMKTVPIFRSFWAQAQGVLDRPRTLVRALRGDVKALNATGRSQWPWGTSTGMVSRTWRWPMTI